MTGPGMLAVAARFVVPAALAALPPAMDSQVARLMLLAIAMQESRFLARRQAGSGPAMGFWQFEQSATAAVLTHHATADAAEGLCELLCYDPLSLASVHAALAANDILAAGFARLLLYTLPARLPAWGDAVASWEQYLSTWRPGRPRPATWTGCYEAARRAVVEAQGQPSQGGGRPTGVQILDDSLTSA